MKHIVIIMPYMGSGGAEKSLSSLLNTLPPNDYDISLMIVKDKGLFYNQIPQYINRINAPENLKLALGSIHDKYFKSIKRGKQITKILFNIFLRLRPIISKLDTFQFTWKYWNKHIPMLNKEYDIAISYMNGITNYYVVDKIIAKKKILWVHNDYNKLEADNKFDYYYFKKADNIVTISPICVNSLANNFPNINPSKFVCIPNLSSGRIIKKMSEELYPEEYNGFNDILKIISVGRLEKQKGFDIAVKTAKILKDNNIEFKWFIIGEGSQKDSLLEYITKNNLSDNIFLLGERLNPYPYIKNANIFVQSSRYEGKSIVLDEAMILGKPIVVTNYPTVTDSVENNKTALIVNINEYDIYKGIIKLINDRNLFSRLQENLKKYEYGNLNAINQYKNLFNDQL